MTCIVGIKAKGKIYIGADRRISAGHEYLISKDPKIKKLENFIVGGCGCLRTSQLIIHCFKMPPFNEKTESIYSYLCGKFSLELSKFMIENGTYKTKEPFVMSAGLTIGYKGQLFNICPNLSLVEPFEDYICDGSGTYHASAVLDFLKQKVFDKPEEAITEAIKIAAGRIWSVDDKIDILSL